MEFALVNAALVYARVDREARVAAASPHELVTILFDALGNSVGAAGAAAARGTRDGAALARAKTILGALDATLDFERGRDVAPLLAGVYRETGHALALLAMENDPKWSDRVRALIDPVAEAWRSIAQQGA